ncbi:MAG: hypothetical protein F4X92_01535 [Gammaproteobacteria bacterium]|nr:hypothetical protein [Gammaproteobacteria bacterium]
MLMLVVEKRTLKSSANSGLRDFRADHAQRWTRDGQETGPGRGVQIDHMTVSATAGRSSSAKPPARAAGSW